MHANGRGERYTPDPMSTPDFYQPDPMSDAGRRYQPARPPAPNAAPVQSPMTIFANVNRVRPRKLGEIRQVKNLSWQRDISAWWPRWRYARRREPHCFHIFEEVHRHHQGQTALCLISSAAKTQENMTLVLSDPTYAAGWS